MKVYESISRLEDIGEGLVLTIGNFDGMHLGHQAIIRAAHTAAERFGTEGIAVMTFDPHPATILHPEKAPGVLMPLSLKKTLLAQAGVDVLIVVMDSFDLLNLSPKDFVDKFLMRHIKPSVVVEGPDFNFGYGRSGDVDTLRQLGRQRNFEVVIVEPKRTHDSEGTEFICSSSAIRTMLEAGRVTDATHVLSRPYRLIGPVTAGRGIGKGLGFPTANIRPIEQVIPAEGVYAGFARIGKGPDDVPQPGNRIQAIFSIGRAKTFVIDHPLLIEAHMLEGEVGDIYGKWLSLDFICRIRSQRRFENENLLSEQIAQDCQKARRILAAVQND